MRSPLSACAGELPVSFASSAQRRTDGGAKGCVGEQPVLGCEAPAVLAAAGGGITLVERFDIEPFPDLSAK